MRSSVVSSLLVSLVAFAGLAIGAAACSDDPAAPAQPAGQDPPATLANEVPGTRAFFSLAKHDTAETFFDLPYPSDLRLTAEGKPDLTGFPNPYDAVGIADIVRSAADRKAFPVIPVAWFRFSAALPPLVDTDVVPAAATSPILLVDVDPAGGEQGALVPVVARILAVDDFTPENVLAVAPRQGFVLRAGRTYAVIVKRSLKDAAGAELGVPAEMAQLAAGQTPLGNDGAKVKAVYDNVFATVTGKLGLAATDVAVATVFTTADVVKELHDLSNGVLARDAVTIDDVQIDPDGGADHERYCQLVAKVSYPQFQQGKPPFNTEGLFVFGADGLPVEQRKETAPIVLTLPKGEMPAGGYPLVTYFHGSGGDSHEVVDLGPKKTKDGEYEKGTGVSYVLSPFGFATAGSALPVNPERLPGASATAYLNISNLPAMRDTFRQGVIEQRLFLEALRKLRISPATVAACTGVTLPAGETDYRYEETKLTAQGLSMGGAYTNMIGAVEPRIGAVVPTGAGGFWTYFITVTTLVNGKGLGKSLFRTGKDFTFQHPVLAMLEQGWETIDPMVFMPRLAAHPLDGHPVRPIYEPVAPGDKYFPTEVYDAMAIAYENQLAGPEVWPTMHDAIALRGSAVTVDYPVKQNKTSATGKAYTGAVVQYAGDGIGDPHVICTQLDAVKYQFGCFHASFAKTGVATIPAPAALGTPCPE